MASLNRVVIMGNLGKDPELRELDGGLMVANMSIATVQRTTDKSGLVKEMTEWHRVQVWGKSAAACAKYLKKGRGCLVEGRLQTRKYQKNGMDLFATQIVAENVQFLPERAPSAPQMDSQDFMDGYGQEVQAAAPSPVPAAAAAPKPSAAINLDDIPW